MYLIFHILCNKKWVSNDTNNKCQRYLDDNLKINRYIKILSKSFAVNSVYKINFIKINKAQKTTICLSIYLPKNSKELIWQLKSCYNIKIEKYIT